DGAGVRVAVIDSGIDRNHAWLVSARLEHVRVERRGESLRIEPAPEGGDASGHGTACAGIIHRMVPAATIVDVRALGEDGRCSKNALLAAVRHCIDLRFDVVNLSLGIDVPRRSPLRSGETLSVLALYELADAAVTAGVVLVAAGPNIPEVRTYPGKFKSLIGVGRGSFEERERIESQRCEDHELLAPGTDVVAPALDGGERRWTGTSFATPFVTGHVARILAAAPRLPLEAVKERLHAIAAATSVR
ncbi:MAG: S8 family serine peptidase, partial [Deltaproteobacteria bacterium]|nr:S8 family serine peptidase [Deltaproteobacteria bacterium]